MAVPFPRCAVPLLAAATLFGATVENQAEHFEMKIRPILANRCFSCHTTSALGGFAMNSRADLLKGGKTGPAVIPGKPEESLLIQAIEHSNDKLKMPLGQGKMPGEEIALLVDWVKTGAYWPEPKTSSVPAGNKYVITPEQRAFWSFQPVRKPALPEVTDPAWVTTPIDRFVLHELEAKGLKPNRQAAKRDLIRRAYLDLTGLPPGFEETQAFEKDNSPDAYTKVVDRLLASPRYGERWGRYWLDVARYADDRLDSDVELPYPNSFRYRDWVIDAFNADMPYDLFVKAQIAGDQLRDKQAEANHKNLAVGLGFYGLSPELTDDRVDATTRGFLGLTVACAQCHNHKFDPIPTKDYYALQGIFSSTKRAELELAPADKVKRYKDQAKKIEEVKLRIQQFLHNQATAMAEMLAADSPRYIRAARKVTGFQKLGVAEVAKADRLDQETLERWIKYLKTGPRDNRYLHGWQDESFDGNGFRDEALKVLKERKAVDEENLARTRSSKGGDRDQIDAVALPAERYYLWRDLFFSDFYGKEFKQEEDGILYYGPNRGYVTSDGTIERFLGGPWLSYLEGMRSEIKELQAKLPPQYAFAHGIADTAAPHNERVQIGGQPDRLGEEAPRAFLSILSKGDPKPFELGSGRTELAEAIASPENPLTGRVMANRIWQHHFGEGLVRTVSNFGRMGDPPSNPPLLDYLAATFMENHWSVKRLHREIMLSSTYRLSAEVSDKNFGIDPANRLLWRANRQRLDAESMRDTLLAVSGELDTQAGGPPVSLSDEGNRRRSVYGFVSRRKLDGTLALFDFPNPNLSAEQRMATATPSQQLFFLNSPFVEARARALYQRIASVESSDDRIRSLYRTVYGREPAAAELEAGREFLSGRKDAWIPYLQVLLSSNELLFVN